MAFDVYPQPQTAPLSVPPGGAGTTIALLQERRSAAVQPQMYIRVAIIGSVSVPTLKLQAGAGDAVTAQSGMTTPIFDGPGNSGNYVADCFLQPQPNGVYLVSVYLYLPGASTWKLTIVNTDAVARGFTFVAADSDADSQQPWIEMATAISFDALITETGQLTLRIFNYGTGPLSGVGGAPSGPGAASFGFVPPAAAIDPNGYGDGAVTLLSVATPQNLTATLDVTSNDTVAKKAAGHNSEVALSAKIEQLELGFLLDGSGSMALGPNGESNLIGIDNNSTRWGKLLSGAQAALTLLKNFGNGKGTFGVGVYPDITPFPADPTAPYGGPFPVPSPSANDFKTTSPITQANVDDAINQMKGHFPRINGGATPMGAGIAHAVGSGANAPWGYFSSGAQATLALGRRWLILMTDGNQNSGGPPSDFFNNGTANQGFWPKQVRVAALGYGNTSAPVEPVNTFLLNQIVTKAFMPDPGTYHFAQADATPDLTATFIKGLLVAGLTLDSLADPSGVLTAAKPRVVRRVQVSEYDNKLSFIVAWSTYAAERLIVQVRTPLGELLEKPSPDYVVDVNPRFRMLTFDRKYLANAADPGNPRYGTWTLVISLNPKAMDATGIARQKGEEPYNYQIVADTQLSLRVDHNQTTYATGDKVKLSARILLQGLNVTGAAVTLTQTIPANSFADWLASSPVTPEQYKAIAERTHGNPDLDAIGLKQIALAASGRRFTPVENTITVPMLDTAGNGVYSATLANTGVPGTYRFLVTAVGVLPDGTEFRRERGLAIEVVVRPRPAATPFQVDYLQIAEPKAGLTRATLTVRPLDGFGNAVMLDPAVDSSLVFQAAGGTFAGPTTDHHDGSYSRVLTYPTARPATVAVSLDRGTVVPKTMLADIGRLYYIDKIVSFALGQEATRGANQHRVPDACLGDCTANATHPFVSLGAYGSVVVTFGGLAVIGQGHDDVTVFIHADETPRSYVLEASPSGNDNDWIEIGRSLGVTQSFGLADKGHPLTARTLRIRDTSGRMRNLDGTPSATPGVSLLGVGAARLG